jgi:transcriptional regulator with XRE-family HTH domain
MRRRGSKRPSARQRVAANVRSFRLSLGLSQEELAHRAGVHRTYLGAVERSERNVSIDNIEKIARALEVDVAELVKVVLP